MTVSVRPWPEIAADLRNFDAPTYDMSVVRREAAVAGDALAAEVAGLTGALEAARADADHWSAVADEIECTLPDCPTCGGTGNVAQRYRRRCGVVYATTVEGCPDCVHGKVTVAQLAATYQRVWRYDLTGATPLAHSEDYSAGWRDAIGALRAVRP